MAYATVARLLLSWIDVINCWYSLSLSPINFWTSLSLRHFLISGTAPTFSLTAWQFHKRMQPGMLISQDQQIVAQHKVWSQLYAHLYLFHSVHSSAHCSCFCDLGSHQNFCFCGLSLVLALSLESGDISLFGSFLLLTTELITVSSSIAPFMLHASPCQASIVHVFILSLNNGQISQFHGIFHTQYWVWTHDHHGHDGMILADVRQLKMIQREDIDALIKVACCQAW